MPDGIYFLLRPVEHGWIRYESLLDGSVSLEDIADMNDAIDVIAENTQRLSKP